MTSAFRWGKIGNSPKIWRCLVKPSDLQADRVVSSCCLCIIRIGKPSAILPCPTKSTAMIGLMIMFLNLTANYGVFDNYVAERAPFIRHIDYIRSVIEGARDYLQVPPI